MRWIKPKDKFPDLLKTVLVEYFNGDYERIKYSGKLDDWWCDNINAWLDDPGPSFTLEDMKVAYTAGISNAYDVGSKICAPSFDSFMKDKYNVDITKQQ